MFWYIVVLNCSIPAFFGCFYRERIDKSVYPFIYSLVLTLITELLAILSEIENIVYLKSIVYNIFLVANFALFLHFFVLNKIFTKKTTLYLFYLIALANLLEVVLMPKNSIIMLTSILESAVITIGCLKMISNAVFFSKEPLIYNFIFIVAFSTIVLSLFDIFNSIVCYSVILTVELKYRISFIYKTVNGSYYLVLTYAFYCLLWKKK